MTTKDNIERTIAILDDYIEANKGSANIVPAANAIAKLYGALNSDMTGMLEIMKQALEAAQKRETESLGIGGILGLAPEGWRPET